MRWDGMGYINTFLPKVPLHPSLVFSDDLFAVLPIVHSLRIRPIPTVCLVLHHSYFFYSGTLYIPLVCAPSTISSFQNFPWWTRPRLMNMKESFSALPFSSQDPDCPI